MRVRLKEMETGTFLNAVKEKTGLTYTHLALICGVHKRSFSDWANRKTLMPDHVFQNLVQLSKVQPDFEILPDYWYAKAAAKRGGIRRNHLHGNFGTTEGRKRGGKSSKAIHYPNLSEQLAELSGIILGDGGISKYQLTITLNRVSDFEYSKYIEALIGRMFKLQPSMRVRGSVIQIVVSRVSLIDFLLELGFSTGNKVKQQVKVPKWILESPRFIKACIRGLMDTDGCFYVDHHKHKDKTYLSAGLSFTNKSRPFLDFVKENLEALGFHPTQARGCCIFLRREDEVGRYFKEIGSSNSKFSKKFESYLVHKHGEVAEWLNAIASKAIIP